MGIKERIKQFTTSIDINISTFEKSISVANGYVNSISKNIGIDKIDLILEKYPNICLEWLLTGRGEMLKNNKNPLPVAKQTNNKGIPLIPLHALASIGTEHEYQIMDSTIEERYIVPDFDRVKPDYLIRAKGSSMYPKYTSGDILAVKMVSKDSYIQWNKPYVIDTISNSVMVKRIKKSTKENHWLLISDNKDYDPFDTPISDIRSIALVVGVIRLE